MTLVTSSITKARSLKKMLMMIDKISSLRLMKIQVLISVEVAAIGIKRVKKLKSFKIS